MLREFYYQGVEMRLDTRESLAKQAAQDWEAMMPELEFSSDTNQPRRVLDSLRRLGESPNPDDVDAITGEAWLYEDGEPYTRSKCEECSGVFDSLVVVGGNTFGCCAVGVCRECLTKALSLFGDSHEA